MLEERIVRCKQSFSLVKEKRDPWYINKDNYLHWYESFWLVPKTKSREFMPEVDNIKPLGKYLESPLLLDDQILDSMLDI